MTTALVLSGGGSLGAVQVGMLQALGERGVAPDLLVGTSAGAINAAFVGGHGMGADALDELAGLSRSLRREGRVLIDGGIAEHAAIRHALECGADEVYLLPTGFPCALTAAPNHRYRGGTASADAVDPATAHRRGRTLRRTRQAQGPTAAMSPEGLRGRLQPRRRADRQSQEVHRVVAR